MKPYHFVLSILLILHTLCASVDIDLVPIQDAGNLADPKTGYGAVDSDFQISRYDITVGQYCEFLNAVAASDYFDLFNEKMQKDPMVASIKRTGVEGSYHYSVINNAENLPITCVNWFNAARFCNWMHNNQPTGPQNNLTTETGAYDLKYDNIKFLPANKDARYFIPTEDQWYKAAYYKGGSSNAGYWTYPTQSDTPPENKIGALNAANFYIEQTIKGYFWDTPSKVFSKKEHPYLTEVGLFSNSSSPYGIYDMGGNVSQWLTVTHPASLVDDPYGDKQVIRGGSWNSTVTSLMSDSRELVPIWYKDSTIGFRIAAPCFPAAKINIELVSVGDPGNAPDTNGLGAVAEKYKIGKYPITMGQYVTFLNAVAQHGDPYNLYSSTDGCILRVGSPEDCYYRTDWDEVPVQCITWLSAARFCNWMQNGKRIAKEGPETTEQGAYNLNGMMEGALPHVSKNAHWYLPTENQWYKAAYYKGGSQNAGYWLYPNQSDEEPNNLQDENNTNGANYHFGYHSPILGGMLLSPVGFYKNSVGPYGTYDMGGNVWEWISEYAQDDHGVLTMKIRGGSFLSSSMSLRSDVAMWHATANNDIGFRLVTPSKE